jgi:hypothetical protein
MISFTSLCLIKYSLSKDIIFIFFQELSSYLEVNTTTAVIVDKSSDGDFLRIDFNIRLDISADNW